MALEIKPSELTGKAESEIKGFSIAYNFKYKEGEKPELIRARGTKEGTKEVYDVMLYTTTGALHSTVHYSTIETDLSIIQDIVKELYEIFNSL